MSLCTCRYIWVSNNNVCMCDRKSNVKGNLQITVINKASYCTCTLFNYLSTLLTVCLQYLVL